MPAERAWLRMIAPMGEELSPPTQAVRRPRRASAYETLYSPPPTQTSSSGANSIRPCCGGDRRTMLSPSETRSYLAADGSLILNALIVIFLVLVWDGPW